MHHRKHIPLLRTTENTCLHCFSYCVTSSRMHYVPSMCAACADYRKHCSSIVGCVCVLWALPSCGLIRHHIISQIYTESADIKVHALQTSKFEGGEWSVSCLGCFNTSKRAFNIHWIGSWVDPITDVDVVRRENFLPPTEFKSSSSSPWLVTFTIYLYLIWGTR
jgi:hypothetical protein